jgi:hypothetical protein
MMVAVEKSDKQNKTEAVPEQGVYQKSNDQTAFVFVDRRQGSVSHQTAVVDKGIIG